MAALPNHRLLDTLNAGTAVCRELAPLRRHEASGIRPAKIRYAERGQVEEWKLLYTV